MNTDDRIDLLRVDQDDLQSFYETRIEPILAEHEELRREALKLFYQRAAIAAIVALLVAIIDCAAIGDKFGAFPIMHASGFGLVALAFGIAYAYRPLGLVAKHVKALSLTSIAKAVGCKYTLGGSTPEALGMFSAFKLLPYHNLSAFEDCFTGSHRGCEFVFYDANLRHQRRKAFYEMNPGDPVFRGQLIRIAFPKKFHGFTVIRRDRGVFNFTNHFTSDLRRVGLGESRFEEAFEVYSNDQVEARYLIHPVFIERLLALEAQFGGKELRGAFVAGDLLIAIEGGDRFELGNMFKPLSDVSRFQSILGDISEIVRLIEAVLTAEMGALPHDERSKKVEHALSG